MAKQLAIKNKIEPTKEIKVSLFRKDIRKTEPHKHNSYFEVIYLSKGSGTHTIDNISYKITTPMLFFVRKEQIHHWDIQSEPEGFVLILKKTFIERSLDGELKNLFSKLSTITVLAIKLSSSIEKLFELLIEENSADTANRFIVLEGLLKSLLAKALEFEKTSSSKTSFNSNPYYAFRDLLSQASEIKNSVAFYASQLNTTPQNLNAICRKAVNQSAAEVLSEHIINEAKRLLIYTGNTISEIAYSLDFKDASHFVKYFKKHTGFTPNTFRKL